MRVIGVTGGIGSGKTTVTRLLKELGAVVIDADKIGHELLKPGGQAYQAVAGAFGRQVLEPDGLINRQKLAEIVFNSPPDLAYLNRIMHPLIGDEVRSRMEQYQGQGVEVVVIEAPLLIEARWTALVDELWVTVAPEDVVLKRLEQGMGLSHEEAEARIRAQLSQEEKVKHATAVIDTDCSLGELKGRVEGQWRQRQFDSRQK
ncbi:MAG: dephospho-CoA kinase [Dehalococcoidales bacterium]|nr:dephospho-CoA kinase [Dehalococcoidales bacterium]